MKYDMPELVVLIGPPGCGKSSLSWWLYPRYKHFSSDEIREELFGDVNYQGDNNRVFYEMRKRSVEALKNGLSVVYDATNMSRKDRSGILQECPAYVNKVALVVWAPVQTCVERDEQRDRTVGQDVIYKMLKRFEAPYYDEGFDEIKYENNSTMSFGDYASYISKIIDISQDNPHHTLSLKEHCEKTGKALFHESLSVYFAGQYHDIGKALTKTFTDAQGNPTEVAHYYGHAGMGAYMSYGLLSTLPESRQVEAPYLISHHMDPYLNTKYYQNLPSFIKRQIDIIHEADVSAH